MKKVVCVTLRCIHGAILLGVIIGCIIVALAGTLCVTPINILCSILLTKEEKRVRLRKGRMIVIKWFRKFATRYEDRMNKEEK